MKKQINTSSIFALIFSFLLLLMNETLAKRLTSMILITAGIPDARVTELTGLCDKSVRSLRKKLEEGNTDDIFLVKSGGNVRTKIADHEEAIIKEIETGNYTNRQQIVDMIHERYGIKVSLTGVSSLLKKKGIKRLKCGSLPAKADPVAQQSFYEKILYPLMQEAKMDKIVLLFADASHFVMGCDYLGYIYGKVRRFVRTFSGRSRYNVLGALNFITKSMTTITNDTYITSTQICELLKKLSLEYIGKPIFMILDNAKYQKCEIVKQLAASLKITLIYIPPYSPNLNLIERLWKHTKSRLRIKYYDNFIEFKEKINSIIENTGKSDKAIIDKLIGEKVQLFNTTVFENVVKKPISSKTNKTHKKVA